MRPKQKGEAIVFDTYRKHNVSITMDVPTFDWRWRRDGFEAFRAGTFRHTAVVIINSVRVLVFSRHCRRKK